MQVAHKAAGFLQLSPAKSGGQKESGPFIATNGYAVGVMVMQGHDSDL